MTVYTAWLLNERKRPVQLRALPCKGDELRRHAVRVLEDHKNVHAVEVREGLKVVLRMDRVSAGV